MLTSSSFNFTVRRQMPELVRPARPTPLETKPLSDIDDQENLRHHTHIIHFYKRRIEFSNDDEKEENDPLKVIKTALAETLVFYYPFAGRLREGSGGKLMVECTGEGVMFIEADADVTLDGFGEEIRPPFPCMKELIFNVPGTDGILHSPLLLIQVTRLQCGGFIFGLRLNHTMSDACGLVQFMTAVSEIARGASTPSILPVWSRELLQYPRNPPKLTNVQDDEHNSPGSDSEATQISVVDGNDKIMVCRSFFFGPSEISTLRTFLPQHIHSQYSTFEVLTACLWRCRTIALEIDPNERVGILFCVNARSKFDPPLPKGYYGNVLAVPLALTTAGELMKNSLGYAAELVMKAKLEVTEEYMKYDASLLVMKGRPIPNISSPILVTDLRRIGLDEVDFGWGKPDYAGIALGNDIGEMNGVHCSYVPTKNKQGEKGVLVPVCLPRFAMEKFVQLFEMMGEGN
ncbi:OLC1v1012081C1 [Oldenlandia corymbosa var. corymbosa]|uniref:OLC1v1012081C1 n=1 Tax=Oldenlandia corymbosa var. corymbosa TaxID=529605 RepID=A0AAV1DVQ0_OLDCO|nr:OLC1v1012081C1 [Oldenlandia corymbosa var. corymbosa]